MDHCFSSPIPFLQTDFENLLNPHIFYVGAHYSYNDEGGYLTYHNMLPEFYQKGIWKNGWDADKDALNNKVNSIQRGDILVVKRRNGQGANTMQILALGVVVGFPLEESQRTTVFVSWVIPRTDFSVPLHTIGTISKGQEMDTLDPVLRKYVEKCRVKFISSQIKEIQPKLYQAT